MKVYMIPSISCPICYYQFNIVASGDPGHEIAKLVHEPYFVNGAPCPQLGMSSLINLADYEKELPHVQM